MIDDCDIPYTFTWIHENEHAKDLLLSKYNYIILGQRRGIYLLVLFKRKTQTTKYVHNKRTCKHIVSPTVDLHISGVVFKGKEQTGETTFRNRNQSSNESWTVFLLRQFGSCTRLYRLSFIYCISHFL